MYFYFQKFQEIKGGGYTRRGARRG